MNKQRALILAGFLGICTLATAAEPKVFDVRKAGAKGDGKTLDTAAIQKALDDCGAAGGGVVRIPRGTYLSQPLTLQDKTTLQLDKWAKLVATDDPKDFQTSTNSETSFRPFIGAKAPTELTITGKGIIDGSGAKWWIPAEEARRKQPGYTLPRPNLIRVLGCKKFVVQGVTLQNSPKFHLMPDDCDDVLIDHVTILAPEHAANTDAIDPSSCKRVTISHCLIDVGDDNVAIKAGKKMKGREFACENLSITDCVFKHGHGMSIGSETGGGVRNVIVRNCSFEGTENGIRIKSPRGRGGAVENLDCENITMKNVAGAITITCYYPKVPDTDTAQPITDRTPKFSRIRIKNLKATSTKAAGMIVGLPESPVKDVVLENVQIDAATTGLLIRNAEGVQLKNVKVTARKGPGIVVKDAKVEGLQ